MTKSELELENAVLRNFLNQLQRTISVAIDATDFEDDDIDNNEEEDEEDDAED